ncbi:MAG: flagellar protein FlbB [Alphaproteobacteria bacterium]|nr:flagellar protein FlbB [Alphaproteobacteria bacterium]
MLAFSVRVVEVVSGVRTLASGSAFAEETAPSAVPDPAALDKPGEKMAEAGATEGHGTEEKAVAAEEKPATAEPAKEAPKAGNDVIWKDAADSDMDSAAQSVKMEMYQDLSKRREDLDARTKDIQTREALLKAAEQELDRKYQELETIRTEIKGLLKEQSEEEQKRIGALVKIYEGMKPKDAANIFNTLDMDILVEVMTKMSERKLAPVLAAMDTDRARAVTIVMAEQKKLPELPSSN